MPNGTRWTEDEYQDYIRRRANATTAHRANVQACDSGKAPVLEPPAGNGPLAAPQAETGDTGKFLVRVTNRRKRLLDQDNLCAKAYVDCLRYSGIIPNDDPSQTQIEVRQEKVGSKEPEEIVIEVWKI